MCISSFESGNAYTNKNEEQPGIIVKRTSKNNIQGSDKMFLSTTYTLKKFVVDYFARFFLPFTLQTKTKEIDHEGLVQLIQHISNETRTFHI